MKTKLLFKTIKKKSWLFAGFLLTYWNCANIAFAQSSGAGAGASAISDATSEVTTYYDPLKKFIWVVAGVLGLVGAIKVYNKFNSSDPEASKNAAAFVGSGIALYAAEVFIRKMFIE